jgi:hypothetical protein
VQALEARKLSFPDMKRSRMVRTSVLAIAWLTAWLAIPVQASAEGPEAAAPVARSAPELCDSVVRTNCNLPNWHFDRSNRHAQTPSATARADAALRKRRLAAQADAEDEGSVVVTGERITDPNDTKWQRFDEAVSGAVVPDCLTVGQNLGLLALPLVPVMAVSGRCN